MKTLSTFILSILVIALFGINGAARGQDIYLEEWEGGTTAQWRAISDASVVSYSVSGGHPGGYLAISGSSNGSKRIGALVATPDATGDFWTKGVGKIQFDVCYWNGAYTQAMIRIRDRDDSAGGWMRRFTFPKETAGGWATVTMGLNAVWNDSDAESVGWIKGADAHGFHETLSRVYSIEIYFIAADGVDVGIDNFRLSPPGQCLPDLPDPVLVFKGRSIAGDFKIRWDFAIENWEAYPVELFMKSPELPPCGRNSAASRTFVRFVRAGGRGITQRCGINNPERLQDIGFIEDMTGPVDVYVEFYDRKCDRTYRSNTVTAEFSNNAPVPQAGDDRTLECSGVTTPVTVDGSASNDPDGDTITYEWYAKGVTFDDPHAPVTTGHFPTGTHLVVLKVADEFTSKTDVAEITLVDTQPPVLRLEPDPLLLWPPNHTYHTVNVGVILNDCDPGVQFSLLSITTNGADDGKPDGDSPVRHAAFGTNDTEFELLAERKGNGEELEYEIVYLAWDGMFQMTAETVYVRVPHDRRDHALREGASESGLPSYPDLHRVYPNPFNPDVKLGYSLPSEERVRLAVYDVAGRIVRSLVSSSKPAGTHEVVWNALDDKGSPVPSGVYFVRFEAGSRVVTRKIVLMK